MSNILILGGTGVIGVHVVRLLAENEYNEISVTSRKERKTQTDNISYVKGNALDISFLMPLLESKKWDAIIDFMRYTPSLFKERHKVLLSSTKQYIYLSSARVYAESKTRITETSKRLIDVCTDNDYLRTNEYALAKAREEDVLFNSGKHNWTIVRPYITFSEQRIQLTSMEKEQWLRRWLSGKTVLVSTDLLDKQTTITNGLDVAKGIVSLVCNPNALHEVFHITYPQFYTWREILANYKLIIEAKTNRKVNFLEVPCWLPCMGGASLQVKYDRLYNRTFDNSKIAKFVEIEKFSAPIDSLHLIIEEFLLHPAFRPINWSLEGKVDKITGDWEPLKNISGLKSKLQYIYNRIIKI